MDHLPAFGTSISSSVLPTHSAYIPLLLAAETAIKSTTKETHRYGPLDRHQLDIYFPSSSPSSSDPAVSKRQKVLIFLYGGGLEHGDRQRPNYAAGLTYGNVARYFCSPSPFSSPVGGQVTVIIPDYRLISHGASYPSGGEDLALVFSWISSSLSAREGYTAGIDVVVMGNSAGGIHTCTWLFAPEFAESRSNFMVQSWTAGPLASAATTSHSTTSSDAGGEESSTSGNAGHPKVALRGVVLLAVPYHFANADPARVPILNQYYSPSPTISKNTHSPLSLLINALKIPSGLNLPGVKFLQVDATLDPEDEILEPGREFRSAWPDQVLGKLSYASLEGHNHISPPLGLGTGIEREEAWGEVVRVFIGNVCT